MNPDDRFDIPRTFAAPRGSDAGRTAPLHASEAAPARLQASA
jgi:hypothetical protein